MSDSKPSFQATHQWSMLSLFGVMLLSTPVQASKNQLIEHRDGPQDAWHLNYEADDFSDQILSAQLVYAPKNYRTQKAFMLRCDPYYTNFNVAFIAPQSDLMESGKLHNDSKKFAQHGYIYDQKRRLNLKLGQTQTSYSVSVGGQIKQPPNWLPLPADFQKMHKDQVNLSWHSSMIFTEIPHFTSSYNNALSKELFQRFNQALVSKQPLEFTLNMPNNQTHHFELDAARLAAFAPKAVLDFCLQKRQLREDP
ncbi:MAG: hypothetical protein JXR44_01935 [Thiotrichales bacterium]|nr:hypothetical protein [Thiotrichales bacterium]